MFQWWDSIMLFVREHPALIFIGMVVFFVFWVIMIARKAKMKSRYERTLKECSKDRDHISDLSYTKSRLLDLLFLSARGAGNSCHNPFSYVYDAPAHIGAQYRQINDSMLEIVTDHNINTENLWADTVGGLDLMWSVRHIRYLLRKAEHAVANGHHERWPGLPHGRTYDVSDIAKDMSNISARSSAGSNVKSAPQRQRHSSSTLDH